MAKPHLSWLYACCAFLALFSEISVGRKQVMKSAFFHSPEFVMQPGSVINKFYYDIDFPRNHVGIKSFLAEVVDETGEAVPLYDTYLHHWAVSRYYQRVSNQRDGLNRSDIVFVNIDGVCGDNFGQYFGSGSETRRTDTTVPDPYAIEVGNPAEIPEGYEERWVLNIHAIDTRSVVDKLGCTECRCSLYNVTIDEYGRHLGPDYKGGLRCCYDGSQCKVKKGLEHSPRRLYMRYTVNWVVWDESLLPIRIYVFDVTDTLRISDDSTHKHDCQIEYEIEPCKQSDVSSNGKCVHSKKLAFTMPQGGYLIYCAAHQHSGGVGSALYRKDGRVVCESMPIYGNGNVAGNEAGYIVGMSSAYPQPGSLILYDGETLVVESNYSSSRSHTGVMGLFHIFVADQLPQQTTYLNSLISKVDGAQLPLSGWALLILGVVAVATLAVGIRRMNQVEDGYQPISK